MVGRNENKAREDIDKEGLETYRDKMTMHVQINTRDAIRCHRELSELSGEEIDEKMFPDVSKYETHDRQHRTEEQKWVAFFENHPGNPFKEQILKRFKK